MSGGGITEHQVTPEARSWQRTQLLRLVGVGLLASFVYLGLTGSALAIVIVVAIPVVLFVPLTVYAFVLSRERKGASGLLWVGWVSFNEDDLDNPELFPRLTRTRKFGIGRQGLTMGRLAVGTEEMSWRAGNVLSRKSEISGDFSLPWADVNRIDVSDIPGKIRFLGGALTMSVGPDGDSLYGEFLGSRKALLASLRRSPLAE